MLQSISILPTIFFASLVGLIGTSFWLYGFRKERVFERTRFVKIFLLIGYFTCLYIFLFHTFGFLSKPITGIPEMAINVTLFASIKGYVSQGDFSPLFVGVFLAMPLFPLVYINCSSKYSLYKMIAVTFCFVLLFEPIQFLGNILSASGRKVIDVDDLFLNVCGYFIGILLMKLFVKATKLHKSKSI